MVFESKKVFQHDLISDKLLVEIVQTCVYNLRGSVFKSSTHQTVGLHVISDA